MELILISDDKLKIMLSQSDMEKYHIDEGELDYSKPSTRHIIRDILKDAELLTGFHTEGQTFCVKLFTSPHGGCELFVTKGDGDTNDKERVCYAPEVKPLLFSFESFYELVCVCRRIFALEKERDATAYRDIAGRYFLMLDEVEDTKRTPDRLAFIYEYGKKESSSSFNSYIKEYGTWVCGDAVKILGKL